MSKTGIWVTAIVIVLVIGGGIWWSRANMNQGANQNSSATNAPASGGTAAAPQQSATSSDQAISQEMSEMNVQMNGMASDSASVDQGLNDQPVQQSQM